MLVTPYKPLIAAIRLLKVRLALLDLAKKSPVGLKVLNQAISKLGKTAEEASDVVLQLVSIVHQMCMVG